MNLPKASLEQWIVFQTVIEEGSFAKAALKLHKSQSTISYTLTKLQEQLGLELFVIKGRKAVLTEMGKQMLNYSRHLIRSAQDLEGSAKHVREGAEKSITLTVDGIFPRQPLFSALEKFNAANHYTRLIIREGILSGPTEALENGSADLAITSKIPDGFLGEKVIDIVSLPYAHIDSPLHRMGTLNPEDLLAERYIVVMDSGKKQNRNEGWLGSENQWKVDSIDLKISLVAAGIGFSWLPQRLVEERGVPLKPLLFSEDVSRLYPLYLVVRDPKHVGPSMAGLVALLKEAAVA